MGEIDKRSKKLLEKSERVADIINAEFYGGEQVLKAENIQERDTESIFIGKNGKKSESYTIERDIVKEAVLESRVVLISLESQTGIHYAMPVRVMQGDALQYHTQIKNIAKEHKEKKDLKGDEYISGFSKEDKLAPSSTICVYWGTEPWDGPRCLKDMLNLEGVSKKLQENIADYPLNLIEANRIEDIDAYKTDLRLIFGFLQKREDKEALSGFMEENKEGFQNLDEDAYDFLSVLTHSEELEKMREEMLEQIENEMQEERKGIDMCKAIKDMIEDGRQEGIKEGERIVVRVFKLNAAGKSIEEISKECEISVEKVEEILNMFAA